MESDPHVLQAAVGASWLFAAVVQANVERSASKEAQARPARGSTRPASTRNSPCAACLGAQSTSPNTCTALDARAQAPAARGAGTAPDRQMPPLRSARPWRLRMRRALA